MTRMLPLYVLLLAATAARALTFSPALDVDMSKNSLWFDERPRRLGWLLLLLPVLAVLLVAVGTNLWRDQAPRVAVPAVVRCNWSHARPAQK